MNGIELTHPDPDSNIYCLVCERLMSENHFENIEVPVCRECETQLRECPICGANKLADLCGESYCFSCEETITKRCKCCNSKLDEHGICMACGSVWETE